MQHWAALGLGGLGDQENPTPWLRKRWAPGMVRPGPQHTLRLGQTCRPPLLVSKRSTLVPHRPKPAC